MCKWTRKRNAKRGNASGDCCFEATSTQCVRRLNSFSSWWGTIIVIIISDNYTAVTRAAWPEAYRAVDLLLQLLLQALHRVLAVPLDGAEGGHVRVLPEDVFGHGEVPVMYDWSGELIDEHEKIDARPETRRAGRMKTRNVYFGSLQASCGRGTSGSGSLWPTKSSTMHVRTYV